MNDIPSPILDEGAIRADERERVAQRVEDGALHLMSSPGLDAVGANLTAAILKKAAVIARTDPDPVKPTNVEAAVRADERERVLADVYHWADRLGIAPIEVPAIVALLVDTSPSTPADLAWAKRVAAEILDDPRSGEVS